MEANVDIMYLLQKGCEYLNIQRNIPKAYEYFTEARKGIENTYGEKNKLCYFVNMFDFIWDEYHGDYRQAVLKLADAGEMLESFQEQEVVDEFTDRIFENKKEILEGLAADTFMVMTHLDFEFSPGDIMWQAVLSGNDREELINRTFIDKMGLPRKFHYLIQNMFNMESSAELDADVIGLMDFVQKMEKRDLSALNQEEKMAGAKKLYGLMQKNISKWGKELGAGMSIFMEENKKNIDHTLLKGMIKFGEEDFAKELLERLEQEDFSDVSSQLEIMRMECWLEYKKGNKVIAEDILENMVQLIEKTLIQVFAIKNEQEKIEFLNGMAFILAQTVNMCNELRGAKAAYDMVLRTRTLSFDGKGIMANSFLYTKFVRDIQELDEREKRGEDVSVEREECQRYFDQESGGIFSLDSMQVCRKLTDKQAVLEFTIMRDISDYEFYYVFVVTAYGVSAVKLGRCEEIDISIEGLEKYISEYAVSKYSKSQIRMIKEYFEIYQKVLQPIGEVLSQSVQRLFIAGAGRFLEFPFGMLPCFHWYDEFMEEKYQISYINSGKELLRDIRFMKDYDAVVIGSPEFNCNYPSLPSSLRETEAVADILHVRPYIGAEAVPECMQKQVGIFHISTHSFKENRRDKNVDPMELTGLVFSAGQKMTAREISRLDMSKTNLIVLSVCGEKDEKGVYSDLGFGIRRAFINAGARCLVLNLWKTDDNAVEILMKSFYHYYIIEKMGVEQSLQKAKNYLRTSTVESIRRGDYYDEGMEELFVSMSEEEIPYDHPYYWAGFIVVGM